MSAPQQFSKISQATQFIIDQLGSDIRLATPLGLGKPNQLLNEIYDHACDTPTTSLKIYTALSLALPDVKEDLGRRFFAPFAKRHLGDNYPQLKYSVAALRDKIPKNISVHEFYLQAGTALRSKHLQRNYQSVNYTHAAENILRVGANVIVQLMACKKKDGKTLYSLSCNPDLTLDVVDLYKQADQKILVIGVVHPDLPFLAGDAQVPEEFFDAIVDSSEVTHELFALPRIPISKEDHLIGYYASLLIRDEGTLQIGIGSLADAVVAALIVRQNQNGLYLKLKSFLKPIPKAQSSPFTKGLYGLTELLTDGFMHLRTSQILKRYVSDESSSEQTYLHGSFILGSKPFYKWLKNLPPEEAKGLRMTRVSKVNDLYDPQESLLRQQRIHPRFLNTTMQMSLLGEAMSETLPNANVVSGVGGQYNFVAMSSELKDSISVLMLRSFRIDNKGRRVSNIVWDPRHITIPRHLRDVVITEYGIAELKGKTDEECIIAMLAITDSQFQEQLLRLAQKNHKVSKEFVLPAEFKNNTPDATNKWTQQLEFKQILSPFPFGSDFTPEEERLAVALEALQKDKKVSLWKLVQKIICTKPSGNNFAAELERMDLKNPKTIKEKIYKRLISIYLSDER